GVVLVVGGAEYRYYACPLISYMGRCWYASFPSSCNIAPWRSKPMMTTAPHNAPDHTPEAVWLMAFAWRANPWQLGCSRGQGHQPRARPMAARDLHRRRDAGAQAQARCGLGATAPGVSWDEAGRGGGWWQRFLPAPGRSHAVGDASSLAGKRRTRRATSEGWDGRQVLRRLRRSPHGARQGWQGGQGPAGEAEAPRPRPRAWATRTQARARTTPRSQ